VELKDGLDRVQGRKYRVCGRGLSDMDLLPTYFGHGARVHCTAKSFRDQLRPEADAEDGQAAGGGGADQIELAMQEREVVVGAHCAAHEDEAVGGGGVGDGVAGVEVEGVERDAAGFERGPDVADVFAGGMTECQDPHGPRGYSPALATWLWLRLSA
jgi:hypothetical protein